MTISPPCAATWWMRSSWSGGEASTGGREVPSRPSEAGCRLAWSGQGRRSHPRLGGCDQTVHYSGSRRTEPPPLAGIRRRSARPGWQLDLDTGGRSQVDRIGRMKAAQLQGDVFKIVDDGETGGGGTEPAGQLSRQGPVAATEEELVRAARPAVAMNGDYHLDVVEEHGQLL